MSVSVSLQDLIISRLKASDAVTAIVGDRIYDGVPSTATYPYVSFGPSDLRPRDADCVLAREEAVQIDCWSRAQGRLWPCKQLVDAIQSVFRDDDVEGAVVTWRVLSARVREIGQDGLTVHGWVVVSATIEE